MNSFSMDKKQNVYGGDSGSDDSGRDGGGHDDSGRNSGHPTCISILSEKRVYRTVIFKSFLIGILCEHTCKGYCSEAVPCPDHPASAASDIMQWISAREGARDDSDHAAGLGR